MSAQGAIPEPGVSDHGGLSGLSDDDHSQYALLAGRAGGQTQIGGTASGEKLTLQSTAHATRGVVQSNDPLIVPDGALTATGLRWQSMAAGAGLYAINNNNLAWVTANTERIRFGSGGALSANGGVAVGNNPGSPHCAFIGVSAGVGRITTSNFSTRAKLEVSNLSADGAQIDFTALPTSDPGVPGRLWRDGTTVKVSV
jgi:hypothetical protein